MIESSKKFQKLGSPSLPIASKCPILSKDYKSNCFSAFTDYSTFYSIFWDTLKLYLLTIISSISTHSSTVNLSVLLERQSFLKSLKRSIWVANFPI